MIAYVIKDNVFVRIVIVLIDKERIENQVDLNYKKNYIFSTKTTIYGDFFFSCRFDFI